MTRFAPFALLLACSAAAVSVRSQPPSDAIVDLGTQINNAWNAHDAEAMTALFMEDGTLVTPSGTRVEGHAALLETFSSPGPTKQTTSTIELEAVQWLAEDLVILDAVQSLSGPGTEILGASRGRLAAVAKRVDGQWRIVASRPSVPMNPMARG